MGTNTVIYMTNTAVLRTSTDKRGHGLILGILNILLKATTVLLGTNTTILGTILLLLRQFSHICETSSHFGDTYSHIRYNYSNNVKNTITIETYSVIFGINTVV